MNAFVTAVAIFQGLTMDAFAQTKPPEVFRCESSAEFAPLIHTVRDRNTQIPLVGAQVTAAWDGKLPPLRASTDSTGKIRMCAPPSRTITIRVSYYDVRTTQTTSLVMDRTTEYMSTLDVPSVLVRGTVLDKNTSEAIPNVEIRLSHTALRTLTDANGRFVFARVPMGDYTLRVDHIAFAPIVTTVNVRGDDLHASVSLVPASIALQPIVVTAFSKKLERSGFYERQKRGVGTFIGRKQVVAMNVQRASDLLRKVPGIRLLPQPNRRDLPANQTIGRGQCRYRFLVDGARTLPDFEMDLAMPWEIEGVEVYNGLSEVPAAFRAIATAGPPTCGVVVIWTREGR